MSKLPYTTPTLRELAPGEVRAFTIVEIRDRAAALHERLVARPKHPNPSNAQIEHELKVLSDAIEELGALIVALAGFPLPVENDDGSGTKVE